MSKIDLEDFGGQFLVGQRIATAAGTVPGISAYVEWFIPANPRSTSITFVHGGGGQGAEFVRTSDGRPGWVHAFLAAGFPVFVLDRPGHGRSNWSVAALGEGLPLPNYETLYPRFVEPARHDLWPGADRHTQWSDDPMAGDRFMASQGRMATSLEASQRHVEAIADALFEVTGSTVLLTHSAGGPCGWALAAMASSDLIAAIVAVEPLGFPGYEHALGSFNNGLAAAPFSGTNDPYDYSIAVVTAEASWMRDENAKAVQFLEDSDRDVEHLRLWEHGIFGNGHMLMSEKNSDEIANLIIAWLDRTLAPHRHGSDAL